MRLALVALPILLSAQPIPRTWNAASLNGLELPLAQPTFSPIQISEEAYYRIPERILYKTYPVYHPGREPAGYLDWLKQQEPEIAFNPAGYHTPAQWIAAGDLVFNAPTRPFSLEEFIEAGEAIPPGVTARANTSIILAPQIPDLIGVQDRRFLDHTGLIRQRDIGDLMRYSTLSQDVGAYARYGAG